MIAKKFCTGGYAEAELAKSVGAQWDSSLYMPYLILIIGAIAIISILYIFLGIRGIKQADGKAKKYGHITLATVLLVIDLISCVFGLMNMQNGQVNEIESVRSILMTVLLFLYVSDAKALKED